MKRILCGICALLICSLAAGCAADNGEVQTITCIAEPETTFSEATLPGEASVDITESVDESTTYEDTKIATIFTENTTQDIAETEEVKAGYEVGEVSKAFEYALLKEVVSEDKNAVISPLSVKIALNMAAFGAESDTEREMLEILGYGSAEEMAEESGRLAAELDRDDGSLTLSSSVWTDSDFQDIGNDYKNGLDEIFNAEFFSEDLSGEKIVNDLNGWINKNTNGLIPQMINVPFEESTVMLLVNAIYFNNQWVREFDSHGGRRTFYGINGESEFEPMYLEGHDISYGENDFFRSVSLAYNDGSRMNVYLPSGYTENVFGIAERLSPDKLVDAMDISYTSSYVSVTMPKFECEYSETLTDTLKRLGISAAFDPEKADFSGMLSENSEEQLYISDVIHAAKIKCHEKGTEAAAATIVTADATAAMPMETPIYFTADRPFIYEIVSPSGDMLFMGIISGF